MNSTQNTQSLVLKLKHEDDIRRIRLDNPAQVSFEELQQTIASLYTDLELSSVVLKYVDEDGDKLSITSSLEWQEAVRSFLDQEKVGPLSLLLVPRSVPAAPASESKDDEEDEDQVNFFEALVDTLKALGLEDLEVKVQSIPTQPFTPPFVPPPFFAHPGRFHHPPPHCGPSVPPQPFGHHGYPRPPWAPHHPHQPRQCPPAPFAFGGCPRRGGPGGRGCFRPPHCGQQQQQQQQPRRQPLDETSRCTFATTGPRYAPHSQWFNCVTCGLVGAEGCCLACAEGCHKGHELVAQGPSFGFFCDCGAGAKGAQCRSKGDNKETQVPAEKEDLMKMRVGDLKAVLEARGVSYADCVDKIHLVEKIFASSDAQASSPATQEEEAGPSPVPEEESKPEPVEEEKKEETPVVEEEKKEEEQEENKDEEKTDEEVPPQPAAENPFIEKLQFLQAMGFADQDQNIAALVAHRGDLNGAVAALVNAN